MPKRNRSLSPAEPQTGQKRVARREPVLPTGQEGGGLKSAMPLAPALGAENNSPRDVIKKRVRA